MAQKKLNILLAVALTFNVAFAITNTYDLITKGYRTFYLVLLLVHLICVESLVRMFISNYYFYKAKKTLNEIEILAEQLLNEPELTKGMVDLAKEHQRLMMKGFRITDNAPLSKIFKLLNL